MSGSPTEHGLAASVERRPLVAARGLAIGVVAAAVACFALLAAWVHDTRTPKPIDTSVFLWLLRNTGTFVQRTTIAVTDPVLTIGTCATVAIVALLARRRDLAALAVIGPLAGLVLESYVLKPSINRRFALIEQLSNGAEKSGYFFPSGHQTGVTSATMLLAMLVLRTAWSRRAKVASLTLLVVWTAIAALALVRSAYHYFTDTIGGILLGVAVMITTALLIDLVAGRVSSPAGRDRSRTVPAA